MIARCSFFRAVLVACLLISPAAAKVWISEFVAANQSGLLDRNGNAEDWLELYNDSIEEVSLAGWSLTDEAANLRKWIIPDVTLGPDDYLVIIASGENRRTPGEELHTGFSLSKSGEYLALVQPDGVTVEHAYAPAYPGQFEDVSFGLSQTGPTLTTVVAQGAPAHAGVPASAADFAAEFAGWQTDIAGSFTGSTWRAVSSGVGMDQGGVYGAWLGVGGDFETELLNQNGSIFLRVPFTIADPAAVTRVTLRMRWDDGFIAYLNGTEVAANREPVAPDWNSLATSDRGDGENDDWLSFPIDLSQVTLQAGDNLLAIHGMNDAVDSGDLLLLPELDVTTGGIDPGMLVYHDAPTPDEANGTGATVLPPLLSEVTSRGESPLGSAASPPITVSARVQETINPIDRVSLFFRIQFGAEAELTMADDGVGPDVQAGDGIYTVDVPTENVHRGFMIRWRVEAADTAGEVHRDPAYENPLDSDRYYGTVAVDSSLDFSRLPILHTFVENEGAANTRNGTRVSIYYLGEFYDNVQMDLHGQSTSGGAFPKKSYDLDFNRGNRFRWREGERKVKDINLLTNYADKSKVRNTMAYEFLKRCGTAYHFAFPVRVQRNGAFWSVQDMVEDGDDRYLDRLGLDGNGALYKMYDRLQNASTASKKTRKEEPNTDLATLIARLNPAVPIDDRRRWAYDNISIPACVNYLASLTVIGITDAGHKNYYMYRDTEGTGEWRILPWDVDLSGGRRWTSSENYFHDPLHWDFWNAGSINRLWDLIHNTPDYRLMYLRRVETLRRELLLPPGTPEAEDWIVQMVRDLEDLIDPQDARSDADLDFRKWGSWGNDFQMRESAERMLSEWLPNKRDYIFSPSRSQGGVRVPVAAPEVPPVLIREFDYNPVSGNQNEEYIILQNRHRDAVDFSGWTLSGAVEYVFPPGTVVPGGRGDEAAQFVGLLHVVKDPSGFRARSTPPTSGEFRMVVGGYEGQLSARGETIELRNAAGALVASEVYVGDPSPAQLYLRISELNYHPAETSGAEQSAIPGVTAEDFEWMEFVNTGNDPLDLENVHFTDGIEFRFGPMILGAGERLILAKNPAAFALRHPGVAVPIVGPYTGLLNNDGDELRLVDADGENVVRIDFNDSWYPATDDGGKALVLRDENIPWNLFDEPRSWGASVEVGGTPGAAGTGYLTPFDDWQADHFTAAERSDPQVGTALANPDGDPWLNWQEYAFGLDPRLADEALFRGDVVADGGAQYLGALARFRANAVDLRWDLQAAEDDGRWETVPEIVVVEAIDHEDGTETLTVRELSPIGSTSARILRMRMHFEP